MNFINWKEHIDKATELEITIEGAPGSGKTTAAIDWIGEAKGLALYLVPRQDQLACLVESMKKRYKPHPYRGSSFAFHLPNAMIWTGYLKDEASYEQYRGHEYHRIVIDGCPPLPQDRRLIECLRNNERPQLLRILSEQSSGPPAITKRQIIRYWSLSDAARQAKIAQNLRDSAQLIRQTADELEKRASMMDGSGPSSS